MIYGTTPCQSLNPGQNLNVPRLSFPVCRDPVILELHMEMVARSGAGVLAMDWSPPGFSEHNGSQQEENLREYPQKIGEVCEE